MKPVLNAEKARNLRHTPPDDAIWQAQALQAEGKLVPYLVRNDLIIDILLHKADTRRFIPRAELGERRAAEGDLPSPRTVRRERGLELPQQRRFSAAGAAADRYKLSLFD